jgi:hypothetical protein
VCEKTEIVAVKNRGSNQKPDEMLSKINNVVFLKLRNRSFPEVLPLHFGADCFTIRGAQRGAVYLLIQMDFEGQSAQLVY